MVYPKASSSKAADEIEVSKKKRGKPSQEVSNNVKKVKLPHNKLDRCGICKQYDHEVLIYNGHPNNAVEEYITLTDERLLVFSGKEIVVDQQDERPTHKITHYSVYDKNGHLCPFDTGLIEDNKLLYFSGYVKAIFEEDTSTINGLPTKDMGPINEWWISGFDGGEKALVGFSSAFADYYLQQPSAEYKPLMDIMKTKIVLAKVVIEFLLEENWREPTYEDLLNRLIATGDPAMTEDNLLRHAQFVCDQVISFDATADKDEDLLIATRCMRTLVQIAGVTFKKRQQMRKTEVKGLKKKTKTWRKATTTDLVNEVFVTVSNEQKDNKEIDDKSPRRKRCGVCEPCQTPDCGKCSHCLNMSKFGGAGRSKKACLMRRCPYMEIENANAESDSDEDTSNAPVPTNKVLPSLKEIHRNVKFVGKAIGEYELRVYFSTAEVDGTTIKPGDCVVLNAERPNETLLIAKIFSLWQHSNALMFCAHPFCRGSKTVLGNIADDRELFFVDRCFHCPLGSIVRKVNVKYMKPAADWATNGGCRDKLPPQLVDKGQMLFYSRRYDSKLCRFEDVVEESPNELVSIGQCSYCSRRTIEEHTETPKYKNGMVYWYDEVYKVGSGVFLNPGCFQFQATSNSECSTPEEMNVDSDLYPEYYRKPAENAKDSDDEIPEPFCIGVIEEIKEMRNKIKLVVRKFYRPENTKVGLFISYKSDLNLLYWSDEEIDVDFKEVTGKCYIACGDTLTIPLHEWSKNGPYRFYFNKAYNVSTNSFYEVPPHAAKVGVVGKGKGKGKGKFNKPENELPDIPPQWEKSNPLKCMNVFAGCGGLAEGLREVGIAETKWAIEVDPSAAHAFKLNNPDTIVYSDDCNEVLRLILTKKENTKKLPRKGEVELMVGALPRRGLLGMNRFGTGQFTIFNNSLISSYMSYCDYYRPRYFIFENVCKFSVFKRSMVLKLTLRCLLAIGYQVTFGVLQTGNYGVPQSRRRVIIMAAAPGYVLPKFPEPLHAFPKKACQLSVIVDDFKYSTGVKWHIAAPYRAITIRDAISDLPVIKNGCDTREMPYENEAFSHFQRILRDDDSTSMVNDHICKEMAPLIEARMTHIPCYVGSDWRDLPNIIVKLSDGTFTNKLKYPYRFKKQKASEPPHGVCSCAAGNPCNPADCQSNTLIPWSLSHTANKYNNWPGLYGRLKWNGFFSNPVTNPEPMGQQGRVLHPDQHRVVSVRECARSQGFPDSFKFYGSILDKHDQVGNAIPPPLAAAIGREIQKALAATMKKIDSSGSNS